MTVDDKQAEQERVAEGQPSEKLANEREEGLLKTQAVEGRYGDWYHPERQSPRQMFRVEFFRLIEELVPKALGTLLSDVKPTYEKLFKSATGANSQANVLSVTRGSLSVRGSSRRAMDRLLVEPASLIKQLTLLEGTSDEVIANDFLATFESWGWDHGLLAPWAWNVPLQTLFVWTLYIDRSRPDFRPRWAYTHPEPEKPIGFPIPTWHPELSDRKPFLAAVKKLLDEAELEMENLGFLKEPVTLKSKPPRKKSKGKPTRRQSVPAINSKEDFQRHLQWFVRFQVGRDKQEKLGPRDTIQPVLKNTAERLGLNRRSVVRRGEWSLSEALKGSDSELA